MKFTGSLALPPRPASRPRFHCRGRFAVAYTDPKYRAWLDEAEAELRSHIPNLPEDWDSGKAMALVLTFKVLKPKTSKLKFPKPDIDNYEKSFMDAVTQAEAFWNDDCQVVSLSSSKTFVTDEADVGIDFTFLAKEI